MMISGEGEAVGVGDVAAPDIWDVSLAPQPAKIRQKPQDARTNTLFKIILISIPNPDVR